MNKQTKEIKKQEKRRVIRIGENTYKLLLEIQKIYEKKIGFSPTLKQLIDLGISELAKLKLKEQSKWTRKYV